MLDHLAAAGSESRLEESTAAPSRTFISYTIAGRSNSGDLYLPGEGVPEAGMVLIPAVRLAQADVDEEQEAAVAR